MRTPNHPLRGRGARSPFYSSSARTTQAPVLKTLPGGAQISPGSLGDHPLVLDFLVQTAQIPLAEDFQNRLDEPNYRPSDRLLVWHDDLLAGHVQLCNRVGWFHGERMPLVTLVDFAALPEYRNPACDAELLAVAESTAQREGAVLALVRTTRQDWFAQRGWSRFRGQGRTQANTHAILAHLDARRSLRPRRKSAGAQIQSWRHYELDAIRDVYDQAAKHGWGALQRSEAWWQWLMGRKAQEQVLMAVSHGPVRRRRVSSENPNADPDADFRPRFDQQALGYAVVRDGHIVELFTRPGREAIRSQLLARICRDAIERDHHHISLSTRHDDPLHRELVAAGGVQVADKDSPDGSWMFKLLAPEKWTEKLYPVLHRRARAANMDRPLHIATVHCISHLAPESETFTLRSRGAAHA